MKETRMDIEKESEIQQKPSDSGERIEITGGSAIDVSTLGRLGLSLGAPVENIHFIYERGGVFADPDFLDEFLNDPETVALLLRGVKEIQEEYPNDTFLTDSAWC